MERMARWVRAKAVLNHGGCSRYTGFGRGGRTVVPGRLRVVHHATSAVGRHVAGAGDDGYAIGHRRGGRGSDAAAIRYQGSAPGPGLGRGVPPGRHGITALTSKTASNRGPKYQTVRYGQRCLGLKAGTTVWLVLGDRRGMGSSSTGICSKLSGREFRHGEHGTCVVVGGESFWDAAGACVLPQRDFDGPAARAGRSRQAGGLGSPWDSSPESGAGRSW